MEADSTISGPDLGDSSITPAELAAIKAQALKLAKESVCISLNIASFTFEFNLIILIILIIILYNLMSL